MSDLGQLTDRDILVRISTLLEMVEPRVKVVEEKVLALEIMVAKSSGFFTGAKALWGLLVSIPVALGVEFQLLR